MGRLAEASRILARIPEIAIIRFTERDVVRHGLVRRIVQAYDRERSGWRAPGGPPSEPAPDERPPGRPSAESDE